VAHLSKEQHRLYDLIWKRTVACQMLARHHRHGRDRPRGRPAQPVAGDRRDDRRPGFISVYLEGRDDAGDEDREARLPPLAEVTRSRSTACTRTSTSPSRRRRYTRPRSSRRSRSSGSVARPRTPASSPRCRTASTSSCSRSGSIPPTSAGGEPVPDAVLRALPSTTTSRPSSRTSWTPCRAARRTGPAARAVLAAVHRPGGAHRRERQAQRRHPGPARRGLPQVRQAARGASGKHGRFVGCTGTRTATNTRDLANSGRAKQPPRRWSRAGVPQVRVSADPAPRASDGPFVGCSAYPQCRHIEPLEKPRTPAWHARSAAGHLRKRKSRPRQNLLLLLDLPGLRLRGLERAGRRALPALRVAGPDRQDDPAARRRKGVPPEGVRLSPLRWTPPVRQRAA